MPPLQLIKALGQPVFFAHNLKLPAQFQRPTGEQADDHYGMAWPESNRVAIPQLIPPWFTPAEPNHRDYQHQCDVVGQAYKELHDGMCDAIQFAHNMWKLQAKFQNIQINAAIAVGMPGCLSGPALESSIKTAPMVASWTGNKAKHRDAIAKGVSKCFKDWQDQVTVPGLPWYPAFIAFPGPMAPPMPNVPTPLIACPSAMISSIITPTAMKSEMGNALDGEIKRNDPTKQYEALHDAVATVCAAGFAVWVAAQTQVVLGKGQIPTFAPPYVPMGPVVMGDVLPMPPHLAA